jgi:hypothetical protein
MRLTTVLFTDAIEPSIPFWVQGLGFSITAEVPQGDKLGFVILTRDNLELMLQTYASLAEDIPALAVPPTGSSCSLFFEVSDFDQTAASLAAFPVIVPERVTFYGMREIGFLAPSGHTVVIAVKSPQTPPAN